MSPYADPDEQRRYNREKMRAYRLTEHGKAKEREWARSRVRKDYESERDRLKLQARRKVSNSIALGKMERQPCARCGHSPAQAHHFNGYAPEHWLDVLWLCSKHHADEHRELRDRAA